MFEFRGIHRNRTIISPTGRITKEWQPNFQNLPDTLADSWDKLIEKGLTTPSTNDKDYCDG